MQSNWNLDRIIISIKETFPENFIKFRLREGIFSKIPHILGSHGSPNEAKLRKVPSWSRIFMKFSGNISFIDIMILSKFQVDCISLTNFRNLLYIGKFREIFNFRKILVYKKCRQSPKNDFFLIFSSDSFYLHRYAPKKV